jgi:hypothetical protein
MHSVMADKTPRPITLINQTTPFMVYLARLRHVFGEAVGRDKTAVLRLEPLRLVVTKCS